MSLIPWWWKAAGAGLALVALVVAKNAYDASLIAKGDRAGAARVKADWMKAEAGIKAAAERDAAAETKKAQAETATLQAKFDELAMRQYKDRINHENDTRIAVAAALAGTERLSFAADPVGAGGALHEAGAREGAGAGASAGTEARTYLLPGAAAAVFRIAGDYGQLVQDYNDVVERYGAARSVCNAD